MRLAVVARLCVCAWFLAVFLAAEAEAESSDDCAASGEDPKRSAKLRSQGDDALMKKKYREALALYAEAAKIEPTNEKNYLKLFKAHEKTGNLKAALGDLNKVLQIDAKSITAFAFRGRVYMGIGDCVRAMEDFKTVLSTKPSHGDAKKLLPKAELCAREIDQAEALIEQGRFDLAEQKCTEAMEITGKAPYVKLLRAKCRFQMGNYFESIADTADILKKDQDDQDALLLRGMAYYMLADHEMAMRHFKEGLHKDPEHAETKKWYKKLQKILKLTKSGDELLKIHNHDSWEKALEEYTTALNVDPQHQQHRKTVFTKICKIHAKMKRKQEAKAACDAAIAIDGAMLEPYVVYADLLTRTAEETVEFEEALRAWQRASEVDGDSHEVREGTHKAEVGLHQSKQKNYYKILGVPRDADKSQIKKAYRSLAKEYHPDRHGDKSEEEKQQMEGKFQLVAEAYEVLSSDDLRAKYDRGEEVFENQGNDGGHRRQRWPFGGRGGGGFQHHWP